MNDIKGLQSLKMGIIFGPLVDCFRITQPAEMIAVFRGNVSENNAKINLLLHYFLSGVIIQPS